MLFRRVSTAAPIHPSIRREISIAAKTAENISSQSTATMAGAGGGEECRRNALRSR